MIPKGGRHRAVSADGNLRRAVGLNQGVQCPTRSSARTDEQPSTWGAGRAAPIQVRGRRPEPRRAGEPGEPLAGGCRSSS